MCVRRGVLSSLPPWRARHSLLSVRGTFENIPEFTMYDLSIGDLAIGDLASGDLAIGDLAIESLDVRVRVATNSVKMMKKKIAQNKSSNLTHPC